MRRVDIVWLMVKGAGVWLLVVGVENLPGGMMTVFRESGEWGADSIHAFGVWDSAEHYTAFADGGARAKALEPFKELMTGPPDKAIYDSFFSFEK